MLRSLLQQQAPLPAAVAAAAEKGRASNNCGRARLNGYVLPVVGHAGKFGGQVRPAGGRYHRADRGDTDGRPAAQGRPTADYRLGQLVGAGVGKVS